ncbi:MULTISPECIES: DUF1467 family protein [Actibacterium]|uniref:Putative secreted protein n=1 Tax=Actibacterium naphthalenivorans TaxID=1614693 RepID=A0A840C6A3_9RHOB|nr:MULTISPECIES: DUF1467 family protein [Actibacterium]ALG89406.1 hypothetical protein TQ29_03420 [Actibacterium sp. EMB200-NS6]MBB4020975.1 putative secreted protein [Actibacterium naphthalenivorans]
MSITAALVLFAVIWFMVLFIILPIRLRTQGDEGDVVPGTHAGAPANFKAGRTARLVTVITVVLWAVIAGIILSGVISIRDLDPLNRMTLPAAGGTDG